jgi:hypothetical protein
LLDFFGGLGVVYAEVVFEENLRSQGFAFGLFDGFVGFLFFCPL